MADGHRRIAIEKHRSSRPADDQASTDDDHALARHRDVVMIEH